MSPPNDPPVALTADDLARLFGFTPDELALNRAGKFSVRQRQTLIFRYIGYLVRGVGLIALAIILAAYVTTLLRHPWQWVLFGVLCALIAGLVELWLVEVYRIIMHPTIHTLTGFLRRAGDMNHPMILAGDTQLRVSFRRWKRLADAYAGQYRFYVGPETMLLSIEPQPEDIGL